MGHDPPLKIFKKRRLRGKLGQIINQVIQKAWSYRLVRMAPGDQAHQESASSETVGEERPALACVPDNFPGTAGGCRRSDDILEEFLHVQSQEDMLVLSPNFA
jgi:hypothetical protein